MQKSNFPLKYYINILFLYISSRLTDSFFFRSLKYQSIWCRQYQLSPKSYCIEREEKSEQKQPPRSYRARNAQRGALIFYPLARTAFFSPRCLRASFTAPLRQAVTLIGLIQQFFIVK